MKRIIFFKWRKLVSTKIIIFFKWRKFVSTKVKFLLKPRKLVPTKITIFFKPRIGIHENNNFLQITKIGFHESKWLHNRKCLCPACTLCVKVCQWICCRSVVFCGFSAVSSTIKTAWLQWYTCNWNIVESGL
jgi:hypothetical protein